MTFPARPPAQDYFVDGANLITPEARQAINTTAAALLREQEVPIFVVTIRSLSEMRAAGSSIEDYATALFNDWGIGSQQVNFGVLLLVSLGDRKARIELGEAWGRDHDAQAANIMESLIIPAFKRGDYSVGIVDGVRGLDAMVRGWTLPRATRPLWHWPAMILGGLFLVAALVSLIRSGHSGWAWVPIAGVGGLLLFMMSSRGGYGRRRYGGGGGFGGGSGGGFGGGSSRGGGATGSW
jgi:uncharacterized protein